MYINSDKFKMLNKNPVEYLGFLNENNSINNMKINTLLKPSIKVLYKIGFPCHHKAYLYLLTAIYILSVEECRTFKNDLYPKIAKHYNVTPSSVERCIRYTINQYFTNGNLRTINKYFGRYLNYYKEKLTNKEFILAVLYIVKEKGCQLYS